MMKFTAKIKCIIVALSLLAGSAAHAQLLWRVSGGGAHRPSYLLGSHHVAPVNMLDTLSGFDRALGECSEVWGELDCDSMQVPIVQARVSQSLIAPPDSSLTSLLSPEGYAIVERAFARQFGSMGLTLDRFNGVKPVALSTMMQVLWAVEDFGGQPQAIDDAVQSRARAAGKPVRALETVDFQINLLYNAPLNTQAADLLELCRNDSLSRSEMHRVNLAYLAGDLATILDVTVNGCDVSDRASLDRLLGDRNRRWAQQLPQVMRERPVLVCVGAAHLPGPDGLISLLRKAGFTVQPAPR